MGYTIQSIVARRGVYPIELPSGLTLVQLNGDVQMIPLGTVARRLYGIPFLPLTDEGNMQLPPALVQLCTRLSGYGDIAYIEAEIFGGAGVQAHVLIGAGGKVNPVVVADDAINAALRSIGVLAGNSGDEFIAVGLDQRRETDAWVDGCRRRVA